MATIKKPPTSRTRALSTQSRRKLKPSTGRLARTVLNVEGMVCTSCVDNIESNIGEMSGVNEIRVSLREKLARIRYNPKITDPEKLCEAIEELGFDATPVEGKETRSSTAASVSAISHVDIKVEGMVCQSCVQNIEENISEKKGVKEIKVSLKEKLASVTYDPRLTNPRRVADSIEDMGFEATPLISEAAINSSSIAEHSNLMSTIGIDGMTCHSCVSLIETGIGEMDGVESVRVSLENKLATIAYDSSKASTENFKSAIEDMGFLVTRLISKFHNYLAVSNKHPNYACSLHFRPHLSLLPSLPPSLPISSFPPSHPLSLPPSLPLLPPSLSFSTLILPSQ